MMELDKGTKELLLMTKDYIQKNDFEGAYDIVIDANIGATIEYNGKYTKALLDAYIDPLKYMRFVPYGYLAYADLGARVVTLNKNIDAIYRLAFYNSRINKIIIEGNPMVNPEAFRNTVATIVCNQQMRDEIANECEDLLDITFEVV